MAVRRESWAWEQRICERSDSTYEEPLQPPFLKSEYEAVARNGCGGHLTYKVQEGLWVLRGLPLPHFNKLRAVVRPHDEAYFWGTPFLSQITTALLRKDMKMKNKTEELLVKVREMKDITDGEPGENAMLAQACLDDIQDIILE